MKVEFEGEQYHTARQTSHGTSTIIELVIKLGIAKSATQANIFLIALIVILITISFFSLRLITDEEASDSSFVPAVTEDINTP